jgi:hypothetical protein
MGTDTRARRTAVAVLVLALACTLGACSGDAGADVAPLHFRRAVLATLDGGGHAPYATSTRYAAPGDSVALRARRLPPCSRWPHRPYAGDDRVVATADGFAADGTRQVFRSLTVYSSTRAARAWVRAFMSRGIDCRAVGGTRVAQRFATRPAAQVPDMPVDKILTRYDAWAGAPTTTGVAPLLGSSWTVVTRREAQVGLTTVHVPEVGGDYAALDPATQAALLAYVADQDAAFVRAAFSGRPALRR